LSIRVSSSRPCSTPGIARIVTGRSGSSPSGFGGDTRLIFTPLIFVEAPQCWRRLDALGALPSHISVIGLSEDVLRDRAFRLAERALDRFLAAFNRQQIALTRALARIASQAVAKYNLGSHDAVVIAVSRYTHVAHIAALDRDFRRVDGIELWDGGRRGA
jgi:predicted nucleic acid-binding protein